MTKPKRRTRKQLAISLYTAAIKNGFSTEEAIAHGNEVMAGTLGAEEQREAEAAVLEVMQEFAMDTQEDY